mgnify:CR=1 FL=1
MILPLPHKPMQLIRFIVCVLTCFSTLITIIISVHRCTMQVFFIFLPQFLKIPPNILLFKTIFVLRSLFHKLLCELGAGRIIEVGETIPVVLTDMDAGIFSSDGWFSCGTVYAVIFTVIVVNSCARMRLPRAENIHCSLPVRYIRSAPGFRYRSIFQAALLP